MTATLALAAALALAPQQTGGLTLTNVRLSYRELGATRTDARYLPGDVFYLNFDAEGLKVTDEGHVAYTMGMEVLNGAGKTIMAVPPGKSEMVLPLGGNKLPAHLFVNITPQEFPPGQYTCRVTFADAQSGGSQPKSVEQKFEVLPPAFGIVAFNITLDERALYAHGNTGVVGQTVYANFYMVGFGRDAMKKPDASVEFRVLEAGKPTLAKPITIPVPRDLGEREQFVPFQVPLALNREGDFTIEIKATDKAGGNKTAAFSVPIKVIPASK